MDKDLMQIERRNITNLQNNLATVVKNSQYVFTEMSKSAADIQTRIENLDRKLLYLQKTSDQYLNNTDYIEMLSRQSVPPRDRRRHSTMVGMVGDAMPITVSGQPIMLSDLIPHDDNHVSEADRQRLTDYRRHVKLIPVRREVLYYQGARPTVPDRRSSRKMRRSRSMRDGELLAVQSKAGPMLSYDSPVHHRRKSVLASCLGFLELRPNQSRRRPHSVEGTDRVSLVPVLTTTPSASMELPANGTSHGEEEVRVRSVPAVLVPVDVSGEAFERYCALRRSLRGVEYQKVAVRKRHPRHRSYDALEPQITALQDPSCRTAAFPETHDGHRKNRHSMAPSHPAPLPPQRLATVRRSSSMPATPPASSDLSSWRHSSDLASASSSSSSRPRLSLSQRARQLFRPRSRSAENALDEEPRRRSKSPFRWRRSRDRTRKAHSVATATAEDVAATAAVPVAENGRQSPGTEVLPGRPKPLTSRPPTAVDCPDYRDSLAALGRLLAQRAAFTGSEPLQGIPLHKVKVWLRSGRDVVRNRRARDRYSADVAATAAAAEPPPTARARSSSNAARSSAQEAGQRAKQAFAGQNVTRVSLSQSTSEHLDKLSHQFARAVTLRRSYRHRRGDERRTSSESDANRSVSRAIRRGQVEQRMKEEMQELKKEVEQRMRILDGKRMEKEKEAETAAVRAAITVASAAAAVVAVYATMDEANGNWSATSSSTRPSRSSSTGTTNRMPRSLSKDSALGMHCSSVDRSDLYPPGAASSSSLSSLSTHRGTPDRLHYTIIRPDSDCDPVYALPNKPKLLSRVAESPSHLLPDSTVTKRPPPPPPPRVDSLRPSAPDSWYSGLLPYKCNTLPRNLSTRLRQRDSLPAGIADMSQSWPRPDTVDDVVPPSEDVTPRPSSSSSSSTTATAGPPPSKSLNFAPRAALSVFDSDTPPNHVGATATHRVLKPHPRQAEEKACSPQLRQYRRLYSLGSGHSEDGGDSEYEDEATTV